MSHLSPSDLEVIQTNECDTLKYGGQYLYSRYQPLARCEQFIAQTPHKAQTLYVFFSPLLGYGLQPLLKHAIDNDSFILGIEVDQRLMKLTQEANSNNDNAFSHERIQLLRLDSDEQLQYVLGQYNLSQFSCVQMINCNGGYTCNKKLYDSFLNTIKQIWQEEKQNKETLCYHANHWFSHSIRHRHYLTQDVIFNRSQQPLVLIGAGTSLEYDLDFIYHNQQKLLIFCVDTTVPILIRNNIKIDFVLNLEAQFYNLYDFYLPFKNEVTMFCDLTTHPTSLRLNNTKIVSFATLFGENQLHKTWDQLGLLKDKELHPYGSVSLMALEIAQRLTASTIFISGVDFYYPLGKSHCRGSMFHDYHLRHQNRLDPQPLLKYDQTLALSDPLYYTSQLMLNYKKQFAEQLKKLEQPYYEWQKPISLLGISSVSHAQTADFLEGVTQKESENIVRVQENPHKKSILAQWEKDEILLLEHLLFAINQQDLTEDNINELWQRDWLYMDYSHSGLFSNIKLSKFNAEIGDNEHFRNFLKAKISSFLQLFYL